MNQAANRSKSAANAGMRSTAAEANKLNKAYQKRVTEEELRKARMEAAALNSLDADRAAEAADPEMGDLAEQMYADETQAADKARWKKEDEARRKRQGALNISNIGNYAY